MELQMLKDDTGKPTGVFIPLKDWEIIKSRYPDIDNTNEELQDWEKEIIDQRLLKAQNSPENLKPIDDLLTILKKQ